MPNTATSLYAENRNASFSPVAEAVSILIVDDLPEKLMAYEAILEELGQNLVKARSGEDALRMVLRQEFAVILLDVNMPGMDGFETAALIRQRKKSSHTPIIFLTAFTDEIRMAQGYASGAVDYLPTPVVPEVLKAKVKVFIELSQMRRQAALQAEESARRTAAEESVRRSEFLVRASEALSRPKDAPELLKELVQLPIPYLADAAMVWLQPNEFHLGRLQWGWQDTDGVITTKASALSDLPQDMQAHVQEMQQKGQPMALRTSALVHHNERSLAQGFPVLKSAVLFPLMIENLLTGIMLVGTIYRGRPYDASELALASDLAARAGIALEKVMLMQRIQDADHRKDEFLAMLAHELRNPLAPIRNSLEVMKRASDADLRQQAQDTIERQVKLMIHLIDDLMDVSRITQGKIELRKEHIQVKDILTHAIETSQPLLKQRNHTLTAHIPDTPIWLKVDAGRTVQIFSNLLNNAAKYTDDGGTIEVHVGTSDGQVTITVSDNGIGIPPAMLSRIFDLFSQVDSTLERTQGGLGIGLTLVKSLVEMHGGTITAHSNTEEKGSRFVVTLPTVEQGQEENLPEDGANQENARRLRVLVVDDNEASAKTIGWMIELGGHEIRLAHDGHQAIESAHAYAPDVVLLDIGLPGMNGYDVCKKMREDPKLTHTVFIAQTGWGQQEHRKRSREAGFSHHLVKPIDLKTLQQLLVTL